MASFFLFFFSGATGALYSLGSNDALIYTELSSCRFSFSFKLFVVVILFLPSAIRAFYSFVFLKREKY